MSETVLVTGATGFLGKPLTARLRSDGLEVIAIGSAQGDIADPATFRPLLNRGIHHVFHLAGRTYVPESWDHPQEFFRTNAGGTMCVLEFCRQAGASMTFMSAYLYGVPDRLPISEDAPARPNNPYALSKHLAEDACRIHAEIHGIAVTVLRLFNVYGPEQSSHFLVPSILQQIARGQSVEVLDLEPRRDWLYVDDVVDAVVAAGQPREGYNVYNIGSGHSVSVAELIHLAQEIAGTQLPVRTRSAKRPNEINDTVADNGRAREALRWAPKVTIQEGIKRCLHAMSREV